MKVVGLDLSLTSTGVAVATHNGAITDRITSKPTPNATLHERATRLHTITHRIRAHITEVDLIVVEGPSYGSTNGHQHDRSGLWWLVVDWCERNAYPIVEVPPTCRTRYATGRGNAPKDDVLSAVIRRYPHIDVNGNDEADALILAAMGARHLRHPLEIPHPKTRIPDTHLAAMNAIHWPNPDRAAG